MWRVLRLRIHETPGQVGLEHPQPRLSSSAPPLVTGFLPRVRERRDLDASGLCLAWGPEGPGGGASEGLPGLCLSKGPQAPRNQVLKRFPHPGPLLSTAPTALCSVRS